jgi:hypothetical protein
MVPNRVLHGHDVVQRQAFARPRCDALIKCWRWVLYACHHLTRAGGVVFPMLPFTAYVDGVEFFHAAIYRMLVALHHIQSHH